MLTSFYLVSPFNTIQHISFLQTAAGFSRSGRPFRRARTRREPADPSTLRSRPPPRSHCFLSLALASRSPARMNRLRMPGIFRTRSTAPYPSPDPLRYRNAHRVPHHPVSVRIADLRTILVPSGEIVRESLESLALARSEAADTSN